MAAHVIQNDINLDGTPSRMSWMENRHVPDWLYGDRQRMPVCSSKDNFTLEMLNSQIYLSLSYPCCQITCEWHCVPALWVHSIDSFSN